MIRSSKKRLSALVFVLAVAALAATTVALGEPAQITEKKAEAEQVLAQIQQIDADLGLAVEAYNGATLRLEAIEEDIAVNQRHLAIARRAYRVSQKNLADRIVALYTSGGDDSVLEIVLGSASLDDLLDRVDSVQRISAQDVAIIKSVSGARDEIRARAKKLAAARAEQRKIVGERAARRREIEGKLNERQRLYESVKDQIVQLEAEERERQRRLKAEAQRRLEEAQRAAAAAAEIASIDIPTPVGAVAAAPNQYGNDVVNIAMQFLGVPYVWGGASPSGFDCSGLVVYAYAQLGISVPHYTGSLWQMGSYVPRDQLEVGDLVFFNGLGHMGIYIGGGQMVHAPHTGDVVKISDINSGWYAASYVGARRL